MMYELVDTARREAEANEYYNTWTEKFEVVRMYGAYRVQETFLQPDGTILLLGYKEHAPQPFVVGVHNKSMGEYFSDGQEARTWYARKIAESFGLTVGPPNSVIVRDGDRLIASGELRTLAKAAAVVGEDPADCDEETVQELVDAATVVVDRLEGLGIKTLYRDAQPAIDQAPAAGRV